VHDDDHQQHLPTRSVVALAPRSATKLFSVSAPAPRHVRHRLLLCFQALPHGIHGYLLVPPDDQTGARVNARHAFTLARALAEAGLGFTGPRRQALNFIIFSLSLLATVITCIIFYN
jgi:hypothetical protein